VTGTRTSPPIGRWVRYVFCALLIVGAVYLALRGGNMYLSLGIGAVGVGALVAWGRVLFGTGVTRDGAAIVCRNVPWLEGTVYALPMFLLMGVAAIGLGGQPGYPGFSRYIGYAMVALTPLGALGFARARRLSLLRITPEAITVQAPGRPYPSQLFRSQPVEIPRERIDSITSKFTPVAGLIAHEVQITYRTTDSETPKTWVFGPPSPCQVTVEPSNLLTALQIWKAADAGDPGLMSRLEPILSSRTPVDG
jgi:hypothetical protein